MFACVYFCSTYFQCFASTFIFISLDKSEETVTYNELKNKSNLITQLKLLNNRFSRTRAHVYVWSIDMHVYVKGFPGGSESKESNCNARDLGSIPGSSRPYGEGNG